jgi:hypothetical protein
MRDNMIHIKKDFISDEHRNLIISNLSRHYKPMPEMYVTPELKNIETALGYDPNTRMASEWSLERPILPYSDDEDYNMALRTLYGVYEMLQQELEKTYNTRFRLVNCILNKMLPGSSNPMHTDDQPGFDDPVHTCLIYLSGSDIDFTGGELYFINEDQTIRPERNMLVMFQGSIERPHEVKYVLSGSRETITMQFTTNL